MYSNHKYKIYIQIYKVDIYTCIHKYINLTNHNCNFLSRWWQVLTILAITYHLGISSSFFFFLVLPYRQTILITDELVIRWNLDILRFYCLPTSTFVHMGHISVAINAALNWNTSFQMFVKSWNHLLHIS